MNLNQKSVESNQNDPNVGFKSSSDCIEFRQMTIDHFLLKYSIDFIW